MSSGELLVLNLSTALDIVIPLLSRFRNTRSDSYHWSLHLGLSGEYGRDNSPSDYRRELGFPNIAILIVEQQF